MFECLTKTDSKINNMDCSPGCGPNWCTPNCAPNCTPSCTPSYGCSPDVFGG